VNRPRWKLHLALLTLLAAGIGLLFLREPGFGDDLTYWSFAFDLHERGLRAWQRHSFHDLRWPVWGVCWVLQGIFGPGVLSFYGEPLLYLSAGAGLAFTFGRLITGSVGTAWACGIAFAFHPLLDTVSFRPMPDLSEGVWGAATVLCWWMLVWAETRGRLIGWAALTGACVFIVESNRITGVFIVPVLVLCTLLYAPRRFGWLVAAGGVAAGLYALECAFYHQLFGDWLHSIHANLGNKGAKGTEPPPVWSLPFRFFDTLWKGNPLAPFYCVFAVLGIWSAWRARAGGPSRDESSLAGHSASGATLARVMVAWFATLYLAYACAPQSIWPWRPLIRDADRFLCGLAVPMSVLAALGFCAIWQMGWVRQRRWGRAVVERPALAGACVVALMAVATSRQWFDLGFVPEMRRYMRALPAGTRVFTHDMMRAVAFLADASSARGFVWFAPGPILHRTAELEARAAEADQFWYLRKLVWLNTRKRLEKRDPALRQQPQLGSYFETPERDWRMVRLLAKGDTPDLIFYRRRIPSDPPPTILQASSPEFGSLIPALPVEWRGPTANVESMVPAQMRGQLARVEVEAASKEVEALTVRLRFLRGDRLEAELLLKPYLHPESGREFFAFEIPAAAEKCQVQLKLSKKAQSVRFTSFRVVLEQPPAP
jgi:hypothetical protein